MNEKNTTNHQGTSLVRGGLIHSLTSILRGKSSGKDLQRIAAAFVLITWVPLCLLALWSGTLNDSGAMISFFDDFLIHVRFLLVVPFLILIEGFVDRSFVRYIETSSNFIPETQRDSFGQFIMRLEKLVRSYIPEILLLLMVYMMTILNWNEISVFRSGRNYFTDAQTNTLTAAGWYYLLICSPLLNLLLFRWTWRWMLWVYSIIKLSRFKLQIDPLHADQMAGLQYLNQCPVTLSFILMAPSAVLSAIIGMDIIYHDAVLSTYVVPITLYVVVLPIVLYAPLTLFMPLLIEAKHFGISYFGNLIRQHNKAYEEKWVAGDPPHEPLLGSPDNSSLADINGSYTAVQGIKPVPIDFKMILLSFALNIIPYLPLVFTHYSATELFKMLVKNVIGD